MDRFLARGRFWALAFLVLLSPAATAQQLSVDSPTASESDAFMTFTVSLDTAAGLDVTVGVATSDGTATAGADYTAIAAGSVIIGAGSLSATYVVPLLDDAVVEGDETFDFTLSAPVNATILSSVGTATIFDDDVAAVVPNLDIVGVTVVEGDDTFTPTIATVSVGLSEPTTVDITFDLTTADGTAVAGTDYNALTAAPYTIFAGDTVIGIDIEVLADSIAEPLESFDVSVSNIVGATGFTTTATVWIENDDLLAIAIDADVNGDGAVESSASPYPVNEFNSPNSVLTFNVSGGVGPDYSITLVSTPSLGTLIDPSTGAEQFAGAVLTATGGVLSLEFAGTAQNSSSFEPSDAFIISVIDNGDVELTSGSVIVDLSIADVNQSVVVEREGLAYVASGSVANLALVDFADTDADGIPDPSVYDADGDNLVFSNAVSALGAAVFVSGSTVQYTAPAFTDVASGGAALTDTVTFDASDDSGLGGAPVQAAISVNIHAVSEIALDVSAGDGSFSRNLRLGVGPEGVIDTSPTTVGSIVELTAEQAPPEAPGSSSRAWIAGTSFLLRDIQEISSTATTRMWTIHARTGSTGTGSSLDWYGPDVNALVSQLDIYTGVAHSATIADLATGETWELTGDTWGGIALADNQSYNFEVAFTPSGGGEVVSSALVTGWNLVSIPGVGDLGPLDALSNSAFVWNGAYQGVGFLTHNEVPAVSAGVFINSNGGLYDLTLDVESSGVRDVTASLNAGWNLIGAPSDVGTTSFFPVSNVTAQFANKAAVFSYDAGTGSYALASELVPGSGYWVYNDTGTQVDVQLTQPRHLAADGSSLFHPAAIVAAPAPALPSLDWSLPLSLDTGDGTFRSVQLGLSADASMGYDRLDIALPPSPPVRNYSHLYVSIDDAVGRLSRSVQSMERSGSEWLMNARVDGASGLVEWQRPNVPEHWRLTMETGGNVVDMAERQSVRLGNGSHDLRVMLTWIAPTTTRLMPNYPNPFNPETWIPFELTQAAEVTVRIYGQDGSVVRTLDLGRRAEGYHTGVADAAYWDGRNESGEPVASGSYVYELQAGDFRAMRRMVIMK